MFMKRPHLQGSTGTKVKALLWGIGKRNLLQYSQVELNGGKEGLKILRVYLGKERYQEKNWEGMIEKVCGKLSRWKWVLPKLSYRGRALVVSNLVASMIWHKMIVLNPPNNVVSGIQRNVINFFWFGYHWTLFTSQ